VKKENRNKGQEEGKEKEWKIELLSCNGAVGRITCAHQETPQGTAASSAVVVNRKAADGRET
jgi:hypothetical protein